MPDMWGIIPAAGTGSRIQPLAFSKELLPVGTHFSESQERPRAVSEYLVERMLQGGVTKICFVISPGKSDILNYFGGTVSSASIVYAVQPKPAGLCDAIFRALPVISQYEDVCIGLPDTIWFPEEGLRTLPQGILSLLLFPVEHPEHFDAVVTSSDNEVTEIQVKKADPSTKWIWGALKMPASILKLLHELWVERQDEYLGTLINAYLASGGKVLGLKQGTSYVDVGTLNGYREALRMLESHSGVADQS